MTTYSKAIARVHNKFILRQQPLFQGSLDAKVQDGNVHLNSRSFSLLWTLENYENHVQSQDKLRPTESDTRLFNSEEASWKKGRSKRKWLSTLRLQKQEQFYRILKNSKKCFR
jgi:hypothetical protein